MTQEEVIEYALLEEEEEPTLPKAPVPEGPPAGTQPDALTRREREVAVLVARGLTNRQIAQELIVSERTVHAHLRKVLKKLGLRSRAQVAAWTSERGLLAPHPD